jgi:hypothetical protein
MKKVNIHKTLRLKSLVTILIFCLLISLILTSCLEVKQTININKDGSADVRLEVAVQKEGS